MISIAHVDVGDSISKKSSFKNSMVGYYANSQTGTTTNLKHKDILQFLNDTFPLFMSQLNIDSFEYKG